MEIRPVPLAPPKSFDRTATEFRGNMSGAELLGVIFRVCKAKDVSDVQIRSNRPVYIETYLGMECLESLGELGTEDVFAIYKELIRNREEADHGFGISDKSLDSRSEEKIAKSLNEFKIRKVDDFSCEGIEMDFDGTKSGRLRVQAHLSSSGLGVTLRILSDNIPALAKLGIDTDTAEVLRQSVLRRAGLCLVTGPTGSGKSTTLASIIDWVRQNHNKHIVTIEDPVEYKYPFDMEDPDVPGQKINPPSIVTQQEVGRDLESYRQGLKDVLRKAPHIILIGEIRDRAAMETAMEAAQTGHLVLSTLHTTGAVKTMGRILEMYPRENHNAVLNRLSEILVFIHSQGLLNGKKGRVLTYEFLQNSEDAISSSIANYDKGSQALEDSIRRAGNIQWDSNLKKLYDEGRITLQVYQNSLMKKQNDEGIDW